MPAPIILASSTATGVTRRAYRRAIGREIGRFGVLSVTGTPSTGTTPDADRQILCTSLQADNQLPSHLDGMFVYVVTGTEAGQVRQIIGGTYEGAFGSLLVDRPFSSPLASGTEIEISEPLPGDQYLDLTGLNQWVNEALKLLPVWARVAVTGNGTRSYSLNALPDLTADDISHIEDARSGVSTDPTIYSPYGFSVQQDGLDRALVTDWTYGTADTFTLVSIRNGAAWVKTTGSGTWAASTVGVQSDLDEAAAPLHWVRIWGAVLALGYLIDLAMGDESLTDEQRARRVDRHRRKLVTYAAPVQRIKERELPTLENGRAIAMIGGEVNRGSGPDCEHPVWWP